VLGAGGTVGLAYHAGALRALEQEGGFRASESDLIIGTSAGSVIGAYLRSGWTAKDFWELAVGSHPALGRLGSHPATLGGLGGVGGVGDATGPPPEPAGPADSEIPQAFAPAFHTPLDLARRFLGSAYVITQSVVRIPTPALPGFLGHVFPAGLFSMAPGRRRLAAELPEEWPDRPLWLCSVDIVSGERIVLGRRGAPPLSLADAVAASCAIPGVYPPVRFGRRVLVDGGARSTTNLDLVLGGECGLAICVAPMAFDRRDPPDPLARLVRRVPTRALAMEMSQARREGVLALSLRPSAADIRAHGLRMMRGDGLGAVARAAYESAARIVSSSRFREALGSLAA